MKKVIKETIGFWKSDTWSKWVFILSLFFYLLIIIHNNDHVKNGLIKIIVDVVSFIFIVGGIIQYYESLKESTEKEILGIIKEVEMLHRINLLDNEVMIRIREITTYKTKKKFVLSFTFINLLFYFIFYN